MQKNSHVIKLFKEFQKIPTGHPIRKPSDLIKLDLKLSKNTSSFIATKNRDVYFTRMSLKHIAEKGWKWSHFITILSFIIQEPDAIYQGKNENRFILSKVIRLAKQKPHALSLEITENIVIVTLFVTNKKYLKNFKILWRTENS
jgi:hypothetical protein